jgi:hypothetical protein
MCFVRVHSKQACNDIDLGSVNTFSILFSEYREQHLLQFSFFGIKYHNLACISP